MHRYTEASQDRTQSQHVSIDHHLPGYKSSGRADVANAIADSYLREIFETRIKEGRPPHLLDGAAAD
jgi:hypothetical protein